MALFFQISYTEMSFQNTMLLFRNILSQYIISKHVAIISKYRLIISYLKTLRRGWSHRPECNTLVSEQIKKQGKAKTNNTRKIDYIWLINKWNFPTKSPVWLNQNCSLSVQEIVSFFYCFSSTRPVRGGEGVVLVQVCNIWWMNFNITIFVKNYQWKIDLLPNCLKTNQPKIFFSEK